jgi:hypothetical protein
MKLATRNSKFFLNGSSGRESALTFQNGRLSRLTSAATKRSCAAFTLAEVLAAMLFLAIVIPAAVEALHVSSLAGEVAVRKGAAARIADRILNESLVTTNWSGGGQQNGTVMEGTLDFRWTLTSQSWPQDAMQQLTVEVKYLAQGKDYSVKLSPLANLQTQTQPAGMTQQ